MYFSEYSSVKIFMIIIKPLNIIKDLIITIEIQTMKM